MTTSDETIDVKVFRLSAAKDGDAGWKHFCLHHVYDDHLVLGEEDDFIDVRVLGSEAAAKFQEDLGGFSSVKSEVTFDYKMPVHMLPKNVSPQQLYDHFNQYADQKIPQIERETSFAEECNGNENIIATARRYSPPGFDPYKRYTVKEPDANDPTYKEVFDFVTAFHFSAEKDDYSEDQLRILGGMITADFHESRVNIGLKKVENEAAYTVGVSYG